MTLPHSRTPLWPWLLMLVLLLPGALQAQTRAWLDRAQVEAGETVTLNIQTDADATPDYSPLRTDFELGAQSRNRQVEWVNGRMQRRTLHGVALVPKREGTLNIPPLRVGATQTPALRLQVTAARPARNDGSAVAFVETSVDDPRPYAQQSVGVVVRLYYAAQLASGTLALDTPEGASLQVVGEDRSDVREVGGRRYNVAERRYLLIPERSGPLQLPGARFEGRTAGSFFDDFFGRNGDGTLRARSPAQTLQVRPQPADAPQPWLPLQDLRLRYLSAAQRARSGEAVTIEVEAVAVGATRAQFTGLPVPDLGAQAQVFAEPAQYEETFTGDSPQLKVTRRYAIVPRAAGALTVPGLQMQWWDVRAGQARRTTLPDLVLQVAQGTSAPAVPAATVDTQAALPDDAAGAGPDVGAATDAPDLARSGLQDQRAWIVATVGLALLWLLTLWWGWRRGRPATAPPVPGTEGTGVPAARGPDRAARAALRRALETDSLAEITGLLCSMAGVSRLEQVIERLSDSDQREALQQLQQARWSGQGDVPEVRRRLKAAFHDGPHWSAPATVADTGLPPLYPP
ncbi:BatD family protein [Xanthomonas sp. 60]